MVAAMVAHEGVVGVGVLPYDIDLHYNAKENTTEQASSTSFVQAAVFKAHNGTNTTTAISSTVNIKPMMKSYYSLMEEEEEENQYQSMIINQNNFTNNP